RYVACRWSLPGTHGGRPALDPDGPDCVFRTALVDDRRGGRPLPLGCIPRGPCAMPSRRRSDRPERFDPRGFGESPRVPSALHLVRAANVQLRRRRGRDRAPVSQDPLVTLVTAPSERPVASRSRSYRLVSGNGGNQDSRRTIQLSYVGVSWSGASREPTLTSISSPVRAKTEEPQRGQKERPSNSRVSPATVTASSANTADV